MRCSGLTIGACGQEAVGVWYDQNAGNLVYAICAWKMETIEVKAKTDPAAYKIRRFVAAQAAEPRRSRA